ncbi:MAG TPA: hypothetical protein DCP92_02955 [Nitrospiraceae bacterium]|nr:hypothetical protein [Nitrospiraceae bacterium]
MINKLSLTIILNVLLSFMNPVYASVQDELIKAASDGNIQKVRELVAQGVNINEKGSQKYSALYIAAARRQKEVVTFLLAQGSEVESPTSDYGATPLMAASQNGWEDIVAIMISKGAKVNAKTTKGATPLIQAVLGGNPNVVSLLIKHGADLSSNGHSALILAVQVGNKNMVEVLLSHGVNINPSENDSRSDLFLSHGAGIAVNPGTKPTGISNFSQSPMSPLRAALWAKQEEIALLLIDKGAVIEEGNRAKNDMDSPLLFVALERGMFKAAKALVERGADVNGIKVGYPLMSYFIAYGEGPEGILAAVRFLCGHGADIERRPVRGGSTPLMIAASKGNQQVVELLLSHSANINAQCIGSSDPGATALVFAAKEGHTSIVELLLSKGADITLKRTNGYTSLIDALDFGHREIAKILIANKADVNAETMDHINPLKAALRKKDLQIAQLLVDKGADVNARSMKGYVHGLMDHGDFKTAEFIVKNGLNMNETYEGTTPLYYAAQRGLDAYVELFMSHHANVNIKDQLGRTPLMAASQNGHVTTVKLLLAKGADVNATDSSGLNALVLATQNGHVEVAECLKSKGANTKVYSKQLELISLMKRKGFIPPDAEPETLTPQYLEYIKLTLKELGIEDVWKWNPDPRYATPESTWKHYKQALLDGDFDMAQKCHIPSVAQVDVYKQIGKETTRKIILSMPPLQKISGDSKRATYQLMRAEHGHNISYEVNFTNVFGEWKIEQY